MTIEQAKSELMQIYGALSPSKQQAIDTLVKIEKVEPCEDAISRQAVLKIFEDRLIELQKAHRNDTQLGVNWCINTLKDMPPVNPQPKIGHWVYDNYNWRCSECNETPKTMGYVGTADFMAEHFKFCNHCGAKMESEV